MTGPVDVLWFVVAAAVGGSLRYLAELWLPPTGVQAFPRATLLVNVVGAFVLGLVYPMGGHAALLVGTALCGSLTTFSGVALQLQRRIAARTLGAAASYFAATVVLGLGAAWAGLTLSRLIG